MKCAIIIETEWEELEWNYYANLYLYWKNTVFNSLNMHWNWRLNNNSLKSWTKCRINKYNLSKLSSKLYLPKMNVKHSKSSKTQNGTSMLCFSVFMGHITEGKLVFTLCVEPYYWWMGATAYAVRSCRRFWNYRSISFLAFFFFLLIPIWSNLLLLT